MKKLIAGLFAALLMTAGLVTVTGGPASAACTPTAYVQCAPVSVKAPGLAKAVKHGKTKTIVVKYNTPTNAKASVKIVVKGKGFKQTVVKHRVNKGQKVVLKTKKLKKKGTYTITITVTPTGSKFKATTKTYTFKVK